MATCKKRDPLGTEPVVSGPIKRAKSNSPVAAPNLTNSDAGSCCASGAGKSRARTSLQIALATNALRHHDNQRLTVRAGTPVARRSAFACVTTCPCTLATTTTASA
jgi:hypothetical protein